MIRTCEVRAVRQCGELAGFYRGCDRCRNEVLRWLGSIEMDFQALDTAPKPGRSTGGARSVPGSKSPASDHVIAMLDPRSKANAVWQDDRDEPVLSVPAVVGGWCREAWRDSEDDLPGTMAAAFAYLRVRTDWLMRQDCAASYAAEIRQLYIQLRGHAEPKRKIGQCPTQVGEFRGQVVRCDAPLRASLDDDVIRCWACGASWVRPWTELISTLRGMTELTYPDLALWFKVPVSTLRNWAGEDGWSRGGPERRATFRVVDVLMSYVKRRVGKAEEVA